MPKWAPIDEPVQIGRWRADPRSDELEADDKIIKIEPLKMRLLLALAERPGDVVLTQELLDQVWGDVIVTSSSVYQGIAQLRRVLRDESEEPEYIETVPRKGYRLVAAVRRQPREDPSASRPEPVDASVPVAVAPAAVALAAPALAPPAWPTRRGWLTGAAALGAAGVAGVASWWYLDAQPPGLPIRIAVLPFADRTQGAAEAALAQGLALDVIRAFERYPEVFVTASESVLAAAGSRALTDVAQRLKVGFVLVGELVEAAMRVRVDVRLLALPSERVRWHQQFEETSAMLALLPEAIANHAATALQLPVPAQAQPARASEAYELYLLGIHAWRPKTTEAFAKARGYFERGLEVDPSYPRNYLGLGWMWLGLATNGGGVDWREAFARATPLFDKALRLAPDSAEALTAQAVLRTASAQFEEARALLIRALRINPGSAQTHHSFGVVEFEDGWPQRSIEHFQRAAELNPLTLAPLDRLGLASVTSGKPQDAEAFYRQAIALEPAHPNGYWGLGIKGYALGAIDQAVLHYREALKRDSRRPFLWAELSYLYLDLGAPALAAEALGHTAELLPASRWPRLVAANAWLIRPDRGVPPDVLALTPESAPEDLRVVDLMLIRTMAALPIDEGLLQRALDEVKSRNAPLEPILWNVFQGLHPLIDLAALYAVLGQPEKGRPYLDRAQQQLDRYQRQGNVWHAIEFHRSRLLALRGEHDAALKALADAVAAGCRRGWRLRLDPAFESLRDSPRFAAALSRIDSETARQRASLSL